MKITMKRLLLVACLLVWLAGCTFPVRLVLDPETSAQTSEPLIEITLLPEADSSSAEAEVQSSAEAQFAQADAEVETPLASVDPAEPKAPLITAALPVSQTAAITTTIAAAPTAPKPLFTPQSGTPVATANFVQPQAACAWMGVAGQIFFPDGVPATGLVIEVTGSLAGQPLLKLALAGNSPVLGPGGYEVQLANSPQASQGTLTIQLFDLLGKPLSDKIPFDTYAGANACSRNLILINFAALPSDTFYEYILPLIYQDAPAR